MKRILICIYFTLSSIASATTYYVSSTGDDTADGLTLSTPWRTIKKVNSEFARFLPGDRILFKRGELFTGTLKITMSGSSGNHIILSAYEIGEAPIINGFNTITGWKSEGNGIYSTSVLCESRPNMVTINGINTPMGRYPDSTWLSIDSYLTNTLIKDEELPVSPDWDGAEVVIRKNEWVIDRSYITDHTNHTITYKSGSSKEATDGYGYFIQNDFKTLTAFGEWYYNSSTHIFYMYFGTNVPDEYEVNVSSIDDLIYFPNSNYITLDGLSFRGANKNAIHMQNNDYITIQNCNINFSGFDGIYGEVGGASPYCVVSNNNINHSNNTGISLGLNFSNAKVTNNKVRNSGVIAGMGGAGSLDILDYQGIHTRGDNTLVQYNVVENTGYCGINFFGSNVLIANNFINNFSLIETDAGGIYTADFLIPPNSGQKILNNIVLNGIGETAGAKGKVQTFGIYIDDNSSGTIVSGNTIVNCRTAGIFVHNAHEIKIINNTSYNNGYDEPWCGQMLFSQTDKNSLIRNIVMRNNKFISKSSIQNCLSYLTIFDDADIIKFGTADSNYYARPIDDDKTIMTAVGQHWIITKRNLTNWKSYSNQDANSQKSPASTINANSIIFEFNASFTEKVISLNKPMIDVKGTKYQNSITIFPYSSIVLMVDPNPSSGPTSPVYVSSAIQNSTPSVVEMNYNLALANVVPSASAFKVMVNSTARNVSSVAISGTRVLLTLTDPVTGGDIVTVSYAKPSSNPLQTAAGGQAASLGAQPVTNNRINIEPFTTLTAPVNNSSYNAPANITMTANASDADGSITKVEFYNGTTLIGTKTSAPYSFSWSNVGADTYSLTVVATDNSNAKTRSAAVSVTVNEANFLANQAPVISISNPNKGSTYDKPTDITIEVAASDPDGEIIKVELFWGTNKIMEFTSAPFSYTWEKVPAGTYSIYAVATDNLNAKSTSSSIEFVVEVGFKYDANSEVINLYPNPSDGHFTIDLIKPLQWEKNEIVIVDMAGKKVYRGPMQKEELTKQFDLTNLKIGTYIMMVINEEIIVTKKFIINRSSLVSNKN